MSEGVILAIYAAIGFVVACTAAYLCGRGGQNDPFFIAVMSAFVWPLVLLVAAVWWPINYFWESGRSWRERRHY